MPRAGMRNLDSTCAALTLEDQAMFTVEGSCSAVKVGASCKVECAQGYVGDSVRFFCFKELASKGAPPAAMRLPTCRKAGKAIFEDGAVLRLSWESESCLQCLDSGCTASNAPATCTDFTLRLHSHERRWEAVGPNDMCLMVPFGDGDATLVKCKKKEKGASFWPNPKGNMLCTYNFKGGCIKPFSPLRKLGFVPPAEALQPAMMALETNKSATFVKEALSLQMCKARLESPLADDFWQWLLKQDPTMLKALFSTFPVTPGQVSLFQDIV
eukprot:CAMPEP_0172902420 /NCGR_PEP_ID=MMETSP1075-20121228/168334_1 /TAXON_ID=2916 /ORGANISM="Ceratium fusus, Strain PA161109" /LENGTH=269 /DNA_ID=CAMNT_0013759003 /DNA_START=1 /DNA_END=807 /DNA_ORIENTATION=+